MVFCTEFLDWWWSWEPLRRLLCTLWVVPCDMRMHSQTTLNVEFYSKNKFEKLVHLVGFIIRIYHDVRSPECQIPLTTWRRYIKLTWQMGKWLCLELQFEVCLFVYDIHTLFSLTIWYLLWGMIVTDRDAHSAANGCSWWPTMSFIIYIVFCCTS